MTRKTIGLISWIVKKPYTEPIPEIVEKALKPPEYFRALPVVDVETCKLCGTCERACPGHVIKQDRKERIIVFDYTRCIMCGQCATSCPTGSIKMAKAPPLVPGPQKSEFVGIFRIPAPPPKPTAKPAAKPSGEERSSQSQTGSS